SVWRSTIVSQQVSVVRRGIVSCGCILLRARGSIPQTRTRHHEPRHRRSGCAPRSARGRDCRNPTDPRDPCMTFEIPVWFEITSMAVMTAILIADLLIIIKRPHIPKMGEAAAWVGFYVALALVFALLLFLSAQGDRADAAGQFIAGWL